MGGILTVAVAIGAELLARLPCQNKKQREGLALLIVTALQVRCVNLNELAAALPRAAEGGRTIVVMIDQSKVNDAHQMPMVSLRVGEAAGVAYEENARSNRL
jgi:hypothetical protein